MSTTEKEKAGIITVRLGGAYVDRLDRQCDKTYRTRALWLRRLIDCGELFIDLEQQLLVGDRGRGESEAPG